jgi:hypothetical protein
MVYFFGNLESIEYYQILNKEKKENYCFFLSNFLWWTLNNEPQRLANLIIESKKRLESDKTDNSLFNVHFPLCLFRFKKDTKMKWKLISSTISERSFESNLVRYFFEIIQYFLRDVTSIWTKNSKI